MQHRRTAAALLAALTLTATATACGSDDKKADTTTTTAAKSTSDTEQPAATAEPGASTTAVQETTTTISGAEFESNATKFQEQLSAAGDDFCKITQSVSTFGSGRPTDPGQVKTIFLAFADVLDKVADHLPAGSTADPAVLHRAAADTRTEANSPDLDPAQVEGGPKALAQTDVVTAMAAVSDDITKHCASTPSTTAAG